MPLKALFLVIHAPLQSVCNASIRFFSIVLCHSRLLISVNWFELSDMCGKDKNKLSLKYSFKKTINCNMEISTTYMK